jgi:hypothetical protein
MRYCGNYLNWLKFPNSKKNSVYGNCMRKCDTLCGAMCSLHKTYWTVSNFHSLGTDTWRDSYCSNQSHYREVPWWEIFMEQELRFGLDLGRMANFPAFMLQNLLTYETIIYLKWNDTICGTFRCIKNTWHVMENTFLMCLVPLETPHRGTSL